MNTYFAPPERISHQDLATEIEIVSKNPVVSGLLHSVSGLLSILDEHRQVVALNDSFLQMLGIDDPSEVLGLRHGEVLQCIHADEEPAGCGTTEFCSSCGAAIAIVSSMGQSKPVEKMCALSAHRGDKIIDIALLVKSHPIIIDTRRFLLLFLQDITQQQQRAALERTFFHDVSNLVGMLLGSSELLVEENASELSKTMHQAALRLKKEIAIQRCLSQGDHFNYQPMWHKISTGLILEELRAFFVNHPVARKKYLQIQKDFPDILFYSDLSLLSRVLSNMVINALEATDDGESVKIWVETEGNALVFCVWNKQEISPEATNRIFQRNFSTKKQAGRGIGTYSMKLFGEKILGGDVGFTSIEKEGTIFRFTHPI